MHTPDTYIQGLFDSIGLPDELITEDRKAEVAEALYQYMFTRIALSLDDESRDTFTTMLEEEATEEELIEFAQDNIPNYQDTIDYVLDSFAEKFKENNNTIKDSR